MDSGWLKSNSYTPSAPEKLQVSLGWRTVGGGEVPVVNASWMIRDDGERERGREGGRWVEEEEE